MHLLMASFVILFIDFTIFMSYFTCVWGLGPLASLYILSLILVADCVSSNNMGELINKSFHDSQLYNSDMAFSLFFLNVGCHLL